MKTTIRTLVTMILMVTLISATALTVYAASDNIINRAIADNEALLISVGIEDRNPDGRLRYGGNDFADEAIRARINALRTVFPQNMAFGPRQGVNCTHFTSTSRVLVFGNLFTVNTRRHTDWNQLRVGDTVAVRNRAGSSHSVLVIDISDSGVITIAEGNFGAQVNWDRTFTMADLSATRGWNSGIAITSHFDINGDIMLRHDENGRTIRRDSVTGEIIGFFQSDGNGGYIALNADGTPQGGTAPTTTTPSTPAVTTPQTPATNNQTTAPTAPTQNNTQTAQIGTLTIENKSSDTQRIITFTNNITGQSRTSRNRIDRDSSVIVYLQTNATAEATAGSASITVTFDGQTYTVARGQTITTTN